MVDPLSGGSAHIALVAGQLPASPRTKGRAPEYEVLSLKMMRKEVPSESMIIPDECMWPAVVGTGASGS